MRKIKNINKNWMFTLDAKEIPAELPKDWEKLDLPFTWNGKDGQDGGNNYRRTKGYFAKSLTKKELTANEETYIEFQAVNSTAKVYFNGEKLTTHHGGYSAFRVPIIPPMTSAILRWLTLPSTAVFTETSTSFP